MQVISREEFSRLFQVLEAEGYQVIGPKVRDGAIVYSEMKSHDELPIGITDEQAPGHYRLKERGDQHYFGFVVGPHSWKPRLLPASELLYKAKRQSDGRVVFEQSAIGEQQRYAFLGIRACDLAAIRVQDRVFLQSGHQDPRYAMRRESSFLIGINCLEPGDLCFCTSMKTGPQVGEDVDLRMTEQEDSFAVEAFSEQGKKVLRALSSRSANDAEKKEISEQLRAAEAKMGRSVNTTKLPELIADNFEHSHWQNVAGRCIACGNCTSVCPTCFCSSSTEHSDLSGEQSWRTRQWESCFSEVHSQVHEQSLRPQIKDRYRQWMSHKLSSWVAQFDVSGCVGCGRCIAWCPVGIDITEEAASLREDAVIKTTSLTSSWSSQQESVEEDLVPQSCEVIERTQESSDVVSLRVAVPNASVYQCGQFSMLSLPAFGEAAISVSSLSEDHLEYSIRGVGALTKELCKLEAGQMLGIRGPYGQGWPLERLKGNPLVLIAGGIGIAPLRSVLASIQNSGEFSSVDLYYGARSPTDMLFLNEFQSLAERKKLNLHLSVDRADEHWQGGVGVITRSLRRTTLPYGAQYLMCGPEVMMKACLQLLVQTGVSSSQIYLSVERRMGCATGFCGLCQYGPWFVCKDGPVFQYSKIKEYFGRVGV